MGAPTHWGRLATGGSTFFGAGAAVFGSAGFVAVFGSIIFVAAGLAAMVAGGFLSLCGTALATACPRAPITLPFSRCCLGSTPAEGDCPAGGAALTPVRESFPTGAASGGDGRLGRTVTGAGVGSARWITACWNAACWNAVLRSSRNETSSSSSIGALSPPAKSTRPMTRVCRLRSNATTPAIRTRNIGPMRRTIITHVALIGSSPGSRLLSAVCACSAASLSAWATG